MITTRPSPRPAPSPPASLLRVRSISLRRANQFVTTVHGNDQRYVRDHKFALALEDKEGVLHGVVIAGRPTARQLDTGWRLEILQLATDGTPGASVILYRAAVNAGRAIGYRQTDILTHTCANWTRTVLGAADRVPVAITPGPHRDGSGHRLPAHDVGRWHAASPVRGGHAP